MPALLRMAHRTYATAIREALAGSGFDDLPANGPFVVSGVARTGAPLADVVVRLGVSKQAAGQLVDTLVTRGYLDRAIDPSDRRRLVVTLTERGAAAAGTVRTAVDGVDRELNRRVGPATVTEARATLAALASVGAPARSSEGSDA